MNKLAKEIHANAVEHGWWEEERTLAEIVALCHSELSEALEEYRAGRPKVWFACKKTGEPCLKRGCSSYFYGLCDSKSMSEKPEGIAVEMADCIIRILDWCGKEGVDIENIIQTKHEYNKTRPYKHGGKVI